MHIYTPTPPPPTHGEGTREEKEKKEGNEKPLSLFHVRGRKAVSQLDGYDSGILGVGGVSRVHTPRKKPCSNLTG